VIKDLTLKSSLMLCFLLCSIATSNAQAAKSGTYKNFLGMEFVTVPGGSFMMGSPSNITGIMFDELPQHKVSVPSFQIMSTEVTLAHFKDYIKESSRIDLVTDEFMDANSHGDAAPVVFVSWNDVRKFAYWLNQNKPASDKGSYMLPSEAQWEYACRAGKDTDYCGTGTAGSLGWYTSKTTVYQQTVAGKSPNAYGLYDMSGNAREWVEDCYHDNYENAPSDGSAWTNQCQSTNRVLRGGSWKEEAEKGRASNRLSAKLTSRSPIFGFRIVRILK